MVTKGDILTEASHGMAGSRYLVFTAFVSGSIVMVLELIGSRVIGPSFGVSLFIWTSLITVTLISLALGYWIGGKLADARTSGAALFTIILAAGVTTLLIPVIKGYVLAHSLSLGLRSGSLVSSVVLFAPSLFLLGMVTPYTVKLYMKDGVHKVGKTVGWLYAVSTFGSFLGTVSTGFVLIPSIGVNNIIYLSSVVLLCTGAGYWAFFHRKVYVAGLAALPAFMFFLPPHLPSLTRADGTHVKLMDEIDSEYGQIKVVDYFYGEQRLREFLLENIIQGGIDVNTGLPISKYTYYIERLASAYKPDAKTALVIGLGNGAIPRRLLKYYGIKTDVVDINPDVVKTAEKYFYYKGADHDTYIKDGRMFLRSSKNVYDLIVLDAFAGDIPPSHLISMEAFRLMKRRLSKDGVLLINFIGSNRKGGTAVPASLYRTLLDVFPRVDIYSSPEYEGSVATVVNMIFTASNTATALPVEPAFLPPVWAPIEKDVEGVLSRKVSLDKGPFLFTDDYNPVDFEDMRTREALHYGTVMSGDMAIMTY